MSYALKIAGFALALIGGPCYPRDGALLVALLLVAPPALLLLELDPQPASTTTTAGRARRRRRFMRRSVSRLSNRTCPVIRNGIRSSTRRRSWTRVEASTSRSLRARSRL